MPTVLDSFVLEFALDPSKFTKGQREIMEQMARLQEQARRQATEVEASTKKIYDLMSNFKRESLTVLSAFFGGRAIGNFIDHVTKLDAATGRLSVTMGMSTGQIGQWQGAVRQVGGSVESANAALRALDAELVSLDQTGKSSILGVLSSLNVSPYDANRRLKTADQLLMDVAGGIENKTIDPRHAAGLLRMLGLNDDVINLVVRGTKVMREYLDASKQAGSTSEMSAAQAQEYQRQLALLDQTTTNLGRNLLNFFLPAITAVTKALADLFKSWNVTPGSPEDKARSTGQREGLINRFGHPRKFVNDIGALFGMPGAGDRIYAGDDAAGDAAKAKAALSAANSVPQLQSDNDIAAYITQAAIARGIDPNVALAVWTKEGRSGYSGDHGTSFGPYQLHYGGGLGDTFTARTGKDARDPSTMRAQIDFALDEAKKGGWGPWHGWKGDRWAGIGQGGGGGVTVNVGGVTVNDQSGNADSIANSIGGALKRSVTGGLANSGAQ